MELRLSHDGDSLRAHFTGARDAEDTYVSADGAAVYVTPPRDWLANGRHWGHFGLRVDGCRGRAFDVVLNAARRRIHPDRPPAREPISLMAWAEAPDTTDWRLFDEEEVDGSVRRYRNRRPFEVDTIYLGHQPLNPLGRTYRFMAEWLRHPHVRPPAGAVADPAVVDQYGPFVLGMLGARQDRLGRELPDWTRPIYGFVVTDPEAGGPKRDVYLQARQHPDEHVGAWPAEGAIAFLLSEHPDAAAVRRRCRVFVVPAANPQGVYAATTRGTPEDEARDMNRGWGASGGVENHAILKAAVRANLPHPWAQLDYHCLSNARHTNPAGSLLRVRDTPGNRRLAAAMHARVGERVPGQSVTFQAPPAGEDGDTTCVAWMRAEWPGLLGGTVEESPVVSKRIAHRLAFGEATVAALLDVVAPPRGPGAWLAARVATWREFAGRLQHGFGRGTWGGGAP